MLEQERTSYGQGLGIAGLIFGILAIPFGLIPCTFVFGLVFGIIGIVFGAVAYSQAKRANGPVGLATGALAVSIIGTLIALMWTIAVFSRPDFRWINIQKRVHQIDKTVKQTQNIDKALDKVGDDLEDVLEELEVGDSVKVNIKVDLDKSLEGLSDEEKAKKLGRAAGKALKEFIKEVGDTSNTKE